MVIQSRANPVPVLLTRPADQAVAFAQGLQRRFGDQVRLVATPLMAPRFFSPNVPTGPFTALILTSQTGVQAFGRFDANAGGLPGDVFCVGEQTAHHARKAGLNVVAVARDAAALIDRIKALRPAGKLLHLRGRDARGSIADHLNSAGIETYYAVIYVQDQLPLTADAQSALMGTNPVLVPLFSPRTAIIFARELARVAVTSPIFVAAISGEVALEVAGFGAQVRVATKPDAASMLNTVALLLVDLRTA